MASAIRKGISKVASLESSDNVQPTSSDDAYRLLVTAGPSYDTSTHQTVPVNSGESVLLSNEFLSAKVAVRIRGYRGLPSSSPSSSQYFDGPMHGKDQYSVAFSFVPKQDLPSLDTVWGNDFDHPVRDRLPPGFNTAFKIAKEFIDPGLSCDAYADQPWLYGPALSCWFAFRIGDVIEEGADFPAPDDANALREGADGMGQAVRDKHGLPVNNEKRRKFFLDSQNRKSFVFDKGRVYQADFYNPYLDFGNFSLKLPGFSLKVIKYIDSKSHCLRYVFKNRENDDLYVNINFNLLWGEKLQQALVTDRRHGLEGQEDESAAPTDKSAAVHPEQTAQERQSTEHDSQSATHDTQHSIGEAHKPETTSKKVQNHRKQEPESSVNEITDLLANSATSDKRGELINIIPR